MGVFPKLATIRAIEAAGLAVHIEVLRHGLDEPTAFAVEASVIDVLGMTEVRNRVVGRDATTSGRMSVADLTALYGAQAAVFEPGDKTVLIRVAREFHRGIDDESLYEATRRWWRVQDRRRRLGSRWAPTSAMAVYQGVVRAVYTIEGWEAAPPDQPTDDPKRHSRWGFWGQRDAVMEERFLFTDVTPWLPLAAQNPVRYINCPPADTE